MNKRTASLAATLFVLVLLVPVGSSAITHMLYGVGRPTGVTIGSTYQLFTIAGYNESTNYIAFKTRTGDWDITTMPRPPGVSQWYMYSGVVSATPTSTWAGTGPKGPRLYAISNTTTAFLYEFAYDPSSGTWSWRNLGVPFGANFANSPTIVAGWDASTLDGGPAVMVGVVTANNGAATDGHVYTCRLTTSDLATGCYWEDETQQGMGSPGALASHPLAMNGTALASDTEVYGVSGADSTLWRYSWHMNRWDQVGRPAAGTINYSALQAWTAGSTTYVAAPVYTGAPPDRLYLASWQGAPTYLWNWNEIGPSTGVTSAWNFMAVAAGTSQLWARGTGGDLRYCTLSGTSCPTGWSSVGIPPDQDSAADSLGATFAENGTGYVVGSLGYTEYLYAYNINVLPYEWQNHLAPRDVDSVLAAYRNDPSMTLINVREYSASERSGNVILTGTSDDQDVNVYIWTSADDGSSWNGPSTPFGGVPIGDQSVVHLGSTPYLSYLDNFSARTVMISSANSAGLSWSTPQQVRVFGTVADRPFMAASQASTNLLYMTVVQSAAAQYGGARFSYCNTNLGPCVADTGNGGWCAGTADPSVCTTNPMTWPAGGLWTTGGLCLPSLTNCASLNGSGADYGSAGCQVAEDTIGTVWLTVADDVGCQARPDGYPRLTTLDDTQAHSTYHGLTTSSIGLRRIANSLNRAACVQPSLSAPVACIYYVAVAYSDCTVSPCPLVNSPTGPGSSPKWGSTLDVSRFGPPQLSIAVWGYRDVLDGPCQDILSHCRADVFFGHFDPSNSSLGWCGATCQLAATQSTLLVDSDPVGYWDDHVFPVSVALAYGRVMNSWLDFRSSPGSDNTFTFYMNSLGVSPSGAFTGGDVAPWPAAISGQWSTNASYRDIYQGANGRTHAHFFLPQTTSASASATPAARTTSPFSQN